MSDIRFRFQELTEFLKRKMLPLGVPAENFQQETGSLTLACGGHNETESGWHLADLRYRAVLRIDGVPQSAVMLFLVHCRAWLDENDDTRGFYHLAEPQIDLQPASPDGITLRLSCEFVDPVYITESENGEIGWNGRNYTLDDYDLKIAELGEVNGGFTNI